MPFCDNDPSAWLCADRTHLICGEPFEQLFGGQTTTFIPTADEKELLAGREMKDGRVTTYICENQTCGAPMVGVFEIKH